MRASRRYYSNTAFLDLLFNALIGFVMLFMLAFLSITSKAEKGDIKTKAEFIITVTWNEESKDDVDTYLEDPLGNVLNFQRKDIGLAHLDRDDIGQMNDRITLPDGSIIQVKENQELTSIRGFISGQWVLNLHMYSKRDKPPTLVRVRLDKLNPVVRTIFQQDIELNERWQEITIGRFQMSAQGEIVGWDRLPKQLVFPLGNPIFMDLDNK
ncbi:MAG: hypothetical protein C4519_19530 [Desulfobacteraceae bacterium]|nr:MAG: hypothetical protein C4519_19530 [Desulfobacteraceae bacterium]